MVAPLLFRNISKYIVYGAVGCLWGTASTAHGQEYNDIIRAIITHDDSYIQHYVMTQPMAPEFKDLFLELAHDALNEAYDAYDAPAVGFQLGSAATVVGLSLYLMKLQEKRLTGQEIFFNAPVCTKVGAALLCLFGLTSGSLGAAYLTCLLQQIFHRQASFFTSPEIKVKQAQAICRAQKILMIIEQQK